MYVVHITKNARSCISVVRFRITGIIIKTVGLSEFLQIICKKSIDNMVLRCYTITDLYGRLMEKRLCMKTEKLSQAKTEEAVDVA